MKLRSVFFLLSFFISIKVIAQQQPIISIIPRPVSMNVTNGHFLINQNTSINILNSKKELKPAASFMRRYLKGISGYDVQVKGKSTNSINLSIEELAGLGNEGYQLKVTPDFIAITANSKAGIIYGMQSLFQTLPQVRTNAALIVPAMEITDYPRFKWRGMHMDASRHFFSPEVVKDYINLLATYKFNKFHWHLVDDQGWRIEINKYPGLTKVGAWRVDHTDKAWGDRPQAKAGETPTYGGYYTQGQIKEIIAFAAERNVTVVPEIEMPAHVASAIAAYPNLSCSQLPQLPMTGGNYTNMASAYCAGNEEVFTFLEDVLDEVVELFPSKYIHIGGDELDKGSWKKCSKCQARIKAEGLKDENELQSYFITRMEKYLHSKGRKIIGWDEILEGGLAPDATVMSWRGESGGIEAAKMKHDVIMTPGNPVYFDHYQAGPEDEPLAIGGFNTLRKVYNYEPVPAELSREEEKYVIGAQANVWAEYITTPEHLEYMVLPRMLALSEVVWTPKENREWVDFNKRLKYHFNAFDQKAYRYSQGNFTIDIKPLSKNGKVEVSLSTEAMTGEIFYTLDGTTPTTHSVKYTAPIRIDSTITVKAVTAINGKVMGVKPAEQTFVMHHAVGRDVVYSNPVSNHYMADGQNSLTDGVRGTNSVGKYWHGFYAKDLVATIDLGEEKTLNTISIGCLQNYSDWIFLPSSVKFEVSADGKNYKQVQVINNTVSVNEKSAIKDFVAKFSENKARYVRVTATNLAAGPKGHNGEGQPVWLFADEIIVK